MLHTFLIVVLGVLVAAFLLGLGISLGRWSRRDDIDELEDRLSLSDEAMANELARNDTLIRDHRAIREDLDREQEASAHLRALIGERRIGANPIWSQLATVQPPPIDKSWLDWDGSPAGQTGAWRTIPREVRDALDLHIAVDEMAAAA